MLSIVRRKLSDRFPLGQIDIVEFLRQEIVPVVREMREVLNRFASGPYDLGTVMSGTGAPTAAPSAARAVYLRLDGGAGTTLYVWEGAAWVAK